MTHWLADRVLLRLRLPVPGGRTNLSNNAKRDDLLLIVDATLQLHHAWDYNEDDAELVWEDFDRQLGQLDAMLTDGGSAYTLDRPGRCLVLRVDPTVKAMAEAAIASTPPTAADHIRQAWIATYGVSPDPDKAVHEAIRAVEEIACPMIQNRHAVNNLATLGSVLGQLRGDASGKWELILPDKDGNPRDVGPLVAMMEALWQAQVSRHGGGPKSRRQSQPEAEAAVQLAVTIVHWLDTGVLRRKENV